MENVTRASATPARGSASLPGSERGTPVLGGASYGVYPPKFGSIGNLRAADFGEKIKQLEDIGSRLRGEVDFILKESRAAQIKADRRAIATAENRHNTYESQSSLDEGSNSARPYSLRDLTDITNEQRTIQAMTSQLDEHSLHAENLQHRMRVPSPKHSSVLLPSYPHARHAMTASPGGVHRRTDIILPPSVLERELREAREQNDWLKGQLDTIQQQHAVEVRDYRTTIDDLKSRLYDLQMSHENLLKMQEEERQNQDTLVTNLQNSLRQLQEANRNQEQTLLETNKKVDMAQQNHYILESALSQLRGLMHNVEQRRGRPFFDGEPVQTQSATMLIHTVERFFQESDSELEVRTCKIRQLEQSLGDHKQSFLRQKEDLESQFRERLHNLTLEYDTRINELRDSEASCKRRAESLEEQLRTLRGQNEEIAKSSNEVKAEIQMRLDNAKDELESQRRSWVEKRTALEKALDDSQRETASARGEREHAVAEAAEMEAKLKSCMVQLSETNAVLEEEQVNRRQAYEQAANLDRQLHNAESQLEEKRMALIKMECMIESMKQENSHEISCMLQAEKESAERQNQIMTERLASVTRELENTRAELEESQANLEETKQLLTEAANEVNVAKIQLAGTLEEKNHLQGIVGNRTAEIDRLTSERDYYFRCLDEKTEEVSYLKAEKQRLVVQLEDRLADLKILDQERTTECGNYHHENESLQVKFAEKERELEAMRTARDSLLRRVKAKDKRMKEIEADRERCSQEVVGKRSELEAVYQERNQLFAELKQSRQEALQLANELETLRIAANDRETQLERQLHEVTARLEGAEGDIVHMREAIKAKNSLDKKTVRIAGRMQKEVSTSKNQMTALQSKLRELEENAISVEDDRRRLKEENGRLCRLMDRLNNQNQKLSSELEHYLSKNQQLMKKLSHTEAMAEDAINRSHSSERRIDELEQDMVKINMKGDRVQISNSCAVNGIKSTDGPSATTNHRKPLKPALVQRERKIHEVDDLRTVLGDVRSLLAEYAIPQPTPSANATDNVDTDPGLNRTRASPVGQLLMDRQRPTQTNVSSSQEDTGRLCRRLSGKIDALTKMEDDLSSKAREMTALIKEHGNVPPSNNREKSSS